MYTKLISPMVLSTRKSSSIGTLRYSCPWKLPKIPGNYSRCNKLSKIGFSHGQFFLMFAKFPELLLDSANKPPTPSPYN